MTGPDTLGVLARKLAAQRAVRMPPNAAGDGAALGAWRGALARAARDQMKMALGFESLRTDIVGLTEVLETPMDHALILMLEGPGSALGLMVISAPVLAGMIEMLTLAQVPPFDADAALRKPTRTDAAMVAEMVDAALIAFEGALPQAWCHGYRYGAFIDDPRPLHLLLDDTDYHILRAAVHLEHGARQGAVLLALPVESLVAAPPPLIDSFIAARAQVDAAAFTADLAVQIAQATAQIDAVLSRITLPLDQLLALKSGAVLPLIGAALDCITLQGIDGAKMGVGRLGQQRGMRAVRVADVDFGTARHDMSARQDIPNAQNAIMANALGGEMNAFGAVTDGYMPAPDPAAPLLQSA